MPYPWIPPRLLGIHEFPENRTASAQLNGARQGQTTEPPPLRSILKKRDGNSSEELAPWDKPEGPFGPSSFDSHIPDFYGRNIGWNHVVYSGGSVGIPESTDRHSESSAESIEPLKPRRTARDIIVHNCQRTRSRYNRIIKVLGALTIRRSSTKHSRALLDLFLVTIDNNIRNLSSYLCDSIPDSRWALTPEWWDDQSFNVRYTFELVDKAEKFAEGMLAEGRLYHCVGRWLNPREVKRQFKEARHRIGFISRLWLFHRRRFTVEKEGDGEKTVFRIRIMRELETAQL